MPALGCEDVDGVLTIPDDNEYADAASPSINNGKAVAAASLATSKGSSKEL